MFAGDEASHVVVAGVRYALEYARRQEELRNQPHSRTDMEEEQGGIRHPATDIINALNPINWWTSYLNKSKQPAGQKSRRKRLRKTGAGGGEGRRRQAFHQEGKVMDDEKMRI